MRLTLRRSPSPHCTHSGARFPSKKTLISAQNLENKRLEFFLPARSMVLKVVTGKIFKTWELSRHPSAGSSAMELRMNCLVPKTLAFTRMGGAETTASRSCALVKLSKIEDYLVDNLCVSILSRWNACGQHEKRAGRGPGSKLESRWTARRREQLGLYPVVRGRDVS